MLIKAICMVIILLTGAERFSNDIRLMIGRGVPIIIRFCWCFLSPLILLVILRCELCL